MNYLMKFLTLFTSIGVSATLFSAEVLSINKYLEKEGLPKPDSGIQIVPQAKIGLDENSLKENNKRRKEISKNGYFHNQSIRAKQLLSLKENIGAVWSQARINRKQGELKRNTKDINLAYEFTPLPKINLIKPFAYAPSGGYLKGWNGIVVFFESINGLSCAYTENNIRLSHASALIPEESVQFSVNGKATLFEVEGSKLSGFLYSLDWYDNDFFHTLECANEHYSVENNDIVLKLASRIDVR